MISKKRNVAILIPAHNEENVIESTLNYLVSVVPKRDIFVVNDGSIDKTAKLAKKIAPHVYSIKNGGKANAMNSAIDHFKLTKKYNYIMPLDADTVITKDFLKKTLVRIKQDKKIACVVGKVIGQSDTWINAYRLWEYEISQMIHKRAQAELNAIIVCPGCATLFKSELFEKIKIPQGTQTEDMDFTFLIHRKHLGRIVYEPQAVVITQDPQTLSDFIKQINRWYTGFWQCLVKHNIPWQGQMLDFEVGILALEGLFNGLLSLSLVLLAPLAIIKSPLLFAFPLSIDLFVFLLPTMTFVALRHKKVSFTKLIAHFYFLRFVSSLIFFKSFLKVVVGLDIKLPRSWSTNRYVQTQQV